MADMTSAVAVSFENTGASMCHLVVLCSNLWEPLILFFILGQTSKCCVPELFLLMSVLVSVHQVYKKTSENVKHARSGARETRNLRLPVQP